MKAEDSLKRIPQYLRAGRHMRSVIEHGTPRKWANLALLESERLLRRTRVHARPYILYLDPCNYCNLRCPLCPTGINELGRKQGMMSFECFQRYLEPHEPYLFEVNLYNWGEPLMNKDVHRMIAHAQSRNIGTNMSSNMVLATSNDLDNLIDAGLEHLTVSLDGTDQESYAKYRVRGKFDRVVENMAEIIRRRNARGKKYPFVEWQYIVMKHNQDNVEQAEQMAKSLGVDQIRFIPVGLPIETRNRAALADAWFPTRFEGREASEATPQAFGMGQRKGGCFYLYRSLTVNADGGVSPCANVYKDGRDFDQLDASAPIDVGAIFNNEKFRSARALFSAQDWDGRKRTICDSCDIFQHHASKAPARSGVSSRPHGSVGIGERELEPSIVMQGSGSANS